MNGVYNSSNSYTSLRRINVKPIIKPKKHWNRYSPPKKCKSAITSKHLVRKSGAG
jgi:hypothetical protein